MSQRKRPATAARAQRRPRSAPARAASAVRQPAVALASAEGLHLPRSVAAVPQALPSLTMRQAAISNLGHVLGNRAAGTFIARSSQIACPRRVSLLRDETVSRQTEEPADVAAQSRFNPMDINHKLLIAIDQSAVDAGDPYDKSTWKRKVDFAAVVRVLSDLTAAEARIVRAEYFRHEDRTLQEDLFGKGESGFESKLNESQRAQIRALLAGTKAEEGAAAPEKQEATAHAGDAQAAEMKRLLDGGQGKADVDRIMAILRQGSAGNAALGAAYLRLTGKGLGGALAAMRPMDMIRATMLLAGNVIAADAFKAGGLRGRIAGIDKEIAELEDDTLGSALGSFGGGGWAADYRIKQLRTERKDLVNQVEQLGEQAVADAQREGGSAQERVGAVLGNTDALAAQVRGPDAALIRALARDDPAAKAAAQMRKLREADDLSAEKLTSLLRGLRAEAEERARRMLPPGDPGVDTKAQGLADEYFAKLRREYNALVPEGGDSFDEIVNETGNEGEERLNKSLWVEAGKLGDLQEIILALRGGRKDTEAVERVLRGKSAVEIQVLKMQYLIQTGRGLDFDLFGEAPTTSGEENPKAGDTYLKLQGKAEGTSRLNLEDYMQRPGREGRIEEMRYIAARAEREYEYTVENRGVTGWWRDAWGNEQRKLLDETITEVRRLQGEYLGLVGWVPNTDHLMRPENQRSGAARAILEKMRLARHTIRGDRAAYEKATAELRSTFEAIASFVIQAVLTALLTPAAGALFKGAMAARGAMAVRLLKFVETVSVNTISTVGANLAIHGPDYSLAMFKADLQSGLGGQLGSDAVGRMLGPIAKGLSDRLGSKLSGEIIAFAKNAGSIEGGAWAQGLEGDIGLQNLLKTHFTSKGSEALTKGTSSVLGLTPPPPHVPAGPETTTTTAPVTDVPTTATPVAGEVKPGVAETTPTAAESTTAAGRPMEAGAVSATPTPHAPGAPDPATARDIETLRRLNDRVQELAEGRGLAEPLPAGQAQIAIDIAQEILADPHASAESRSLAIEAIARQAVADFRAMHGADEGVPRLTTESLRDCCGPGRDITADSILSLVGESSRLVVVERMQAGMIMNNRNQRHAFTVVTLPGGARFLVDPTFAQFAKKGDRTYSAESMLASAEGAGVASALMQNGMIPLTPETARQYVLGLGAEPQAADAVAAALLAGDATVVAELIHDGKVDRVPKGTNNDIYNVYGVHGSGGSVRNLTELIAKVKATDPGDPRLPALQSLAARLEALGVIQSPLPDLPEDTVSLDNL